MSTIEKIIPRPLTTEQLKIIRSSGIYNGIGTEGLNLDELIENLIDLLNNFDTNKKDMLMEDLQQLACRHDIEWHYKLGFIRSNIRLGVGVAKLLHWAGWKRWVIGFAVFASVTIPKEARNSYFS